MPCITLLVLALLGPFLGGVTPLHAQNQAITVNALEPTSEFPKGIRFRVSIQSPSPLTEVVLRFRVRGQAASQYLPAQVPPGATRLDTELVIRTDTYERYLPPGSELTYFLEVRAEGGMTLETEPRRLVYLDPRFKWEQVEEGNVSVRYYGPVGTRARTVLQAVLLTLLDVQPVLGVNMREPLRVVMYNNWPDMANAIPLDSPALQQQLITEGQAYAHLGVLLLLASSTDVVAAASHETVHVLVFQAADNPFHPIPDWLNEGLAEYGSRGATSPDYDKAMARAIAQNRLIPFRQLTVRPGKAEDILLMYGQGRSMVAFLLEQLGPDRMREALRLFKGGLSLDAALLGAYGAGLDELENRWRTSLGAPLLPVSGPQVRASPTPIPTLPPLLPPSPAPEATPSGGGCRPSRQGSLDLSLVLLGTALVALVARRR